MKRRYSHDEYWLRSEKVYGLLSFDSQDRVTLKGKPKASQALVFSRNFCIWDDEGVLYDSNLGEVTVKLRGIPCFIFYLRRRRVVSVTFTFNLSAEQLKESITQMQYAKLTKWIVPGLRYFAENLPLPLRSDPKIKAILEEWLKNF